MAPVLSACVAFFDAKYTDVEQRRRNYLHHLSLPLKIRWRSAGELNSCWRPMWLGAAWRRNHHLTLPA